MKRALISVSDKTGLIQLGQALHRAGFEMISTGGSARLLKEAGLPVTNVSDVTAFPEMLDGRVKTLHPKIHGGILSKATPDHLAQCEAQGIQLIDLVVVNLYPFANTVAKPNVTLDEAIENIDIGGPSMIRAAAKNYERVTVLVDPCQYAAVIDHCEQGTWTSLEERQRYALAAFTHTAHYDTGISQYLNKVFGDGDTRATFTLSGERVQELRYGENPHQWAAFYATNALPGTLAGTKCLQGKALSYNNIVDTDAAWALVNEFPYQTVVAIIKHTNPCGVATGETPVDAYTRALAADPVSAFGGIVACNRVVGEAMAEEIVKTFMEVVIAPSFTPEALTVLSRKKNLRVLETGGALPQNALGPWIETISGGFLVQGRDLPSEDAWETVTEKAIDEALMADCRFAEKIVKHVKSNAIVLVKDGQTVGVGAGQMSRVGAAKIAFEEAGEKAQGAVLASDAFFPFDDTVKLAYAHGISAVVQPGGSIRDQDVIDTCNACGLSLIHI